MAGKKVIRVYGHPRSGNHLMMHTLKRNFYPDLDLTAPGGLVGHWADRKHTGANPVAQLFGGHGPWNKRIGPCIYVYRDGRDVAVALWLAKETMHPDWRDLPFSEFLRRPLDWWWSPGHRAEKKRPIQTVAEHWHRHLVGWAGQDGDGVCYVSYEELALSPQSVVELIAGRFSLPMPEHVTAIREPVGNWPDHGRPRMWKEYFSDDDLSFFYDCVPKYFWGLWL